MPRLVWDRKKAATNRAKHGVTFGDATLVFDDPLHLLRFDRFEGGEERWHAVGRAGAVALLLVVHTNPDDDTIRIISARRATPSERKAYEHGNL